MTTPRLSVVVPAYNEAESLPELHRELVVALDALDMTWEVLYVDDGSRDGTDRAIERICAEDPRARGILLSRNFGKSAALATGFKEVRGAFLPKFRDSRMPRARGSSAQMRSMARSVPSREPSST